MIITAWASGPILKIVLIDQMKLAIFFAIILLTFGAYQKLEQPPEIGSKLPSKDVPKKNINHYMTHSGQFRPYITKQLNDVEYVIAYDEKTREVKYLTTDDPDFKNAKGLKVGDYIEVKGNDVVAFPGWEVRGPEDGNGWHPMIGFDSEVTVLRDGKDFKLKLGPRQFHLPADQVEKARIIAFVKGSN